MNVTFFGHSDAPDYVEEKLRLIVLELIEKHNAKVFYIGDKGNFDLMAKRVIKGVVDKFEDIRYYIVLSYLPIKPEAFYNYGDTIFPEELETVPKKFAIDRRNMWMIENCDTVITFVTRNIGGAAKFKNIAERKGKIVININ